MTTIHKKVATKNDFPLRSRKCKKNKSSVGTVVTKNQRCGYLHELIVGMAFEKYRNNKKKKTQPVFERMRFASAPAPL